MPALLEVLCHCKAIHGTRLPESPCVWGWELSALSLSTAVPAQTFLLPRPVPDQGSCDPPAVKWVLHTHHCHLKTLKFYNPRFLPEANPGDSLSTLKFISFKTAILYSAEDNGRLSELPTCPPTPATV